MRLRKRAGAKRDLIERYVFLAEQASDDVAERFLRCAEESFADLALHPALGAPLSLRSSRLDGLRKWRVKEFESVLIFYLPRPDGISIVRVLHAAQDWSSMLGIQ